MTISQWAEDDRPREKMMARGAASLSDAELLAVLLRTGVRGRSAVDVARDILAEAGGSLSDLAGIIRRGSADRSAIPGLGPAKACTVAAALELGLRRAAEEERRRQSVVVAGSSAAVFALFNQQLSALDHEELWAVYASTAGKLLHRERISEGGVSFSGADVRKIVRPAVERMAARVVLCHNHPHGNATPSRDDREVTRKVRSALQLFDIRLDDHIIVADGTYYSFADHGEL